MTRRGNRHTERPADPVVPPAPATVDLHTHTRRSDGTLPPLELLAAAAAVGVRTIAVTDHDTLAGIREILESPFRPTGMEIIPGIEINAVAAGIPDLEEGELHVLGLGVDPDDADLELALARQRERRRHRFATMIERCRDLGMDVETALEALPATDDEDALGRPRLARALVALGHAKNVPDAFDRWLSRGRPCYVAREGLGPTEAIAAIRAAGGMASLAHFADAAEHTDVVAELVAAGLAGLEVHHRSFGNAAVEAVGRVAAAFGLIPTGGSDFHGDGESYAEVHAGLWVPPEVATGVRAALEGSRAAVVR